jgi:hypothetical protein
MIPRPPPPPLLPPRRREQNEVTGPHIPRDLSSKFQFYIRIVLIVPRINTLAAIKYTAISDGVFVCFDQRLFARLFLNIVYLHEIKEKPSLARSEEGLP